MTINHSLLKKLRALGLVEGISTLILFFVAMPLKYIWGMPQAVRVAGTIHGALFVALVVLAVIAIDRVPIGRRLGAWTIAAAVVPFGPFIMDRKLREVGT